MEDNQKLKEKMIKYRLLIISCLIILFAAVAFYGGVLSSCQEGYLRGFKCIEPVKVATVNVCEYNPANCVTNCQDFLIDDVTAFCEEYSRTGDITAQP